MKLYVSGPMSGLPGLNFPAFHQAAELLRGRGFEVVNPAEINPDPNAEWADCLRADIRALTYCDGIVMLPGYEGSRGATLELHIAAHLGMRVYSIGDFTIRAAA